MLCMDILRIPAVASSLYELPYVHISCRVIYYYQVLPPPTLLLSYWAGQIHSSPSG